MKPAIWGLKFGLLAAALFICDTAFAQITPSQDAYTNSASPTTNFGANTLLDVEGATQTTYIQFNMGSIPSGANISQATLKLYVNSVTTAGSMNVDYVEGTWAEGTITSGLVPALGTTIESDVSITLADKNQYILVNVTPAVIAWLNGSQTNDGIALVANGAFNATFDSKENTGTSHAPELDIVFAGEGSISGLTTASGSGLMGGGTSGTLNLSLTQGCAVNQVLEWNGTAWVCSAAGTGTITAVTAGTDLTGGGSSGKVTLNLDTTKVPRLAAANTFTGNQTVNGSLFATGTVTGSNFQIGGNLFAYGLMAEGNAFLGFAGNPNSSLTANSGNTGSGVGALQSLEGGYFNTADGFFALQSNSTGYYNTADGYDALQFNQTGSGNTASGELALGNNTTGSGNTAVGENALKTNSTGSSLTCIGTSCDVSTDGLTNATAIGAGAVVGASNSLVLGSTGTDIGIGTAAPAYPLTLQADDNGSTRGGPHQFVIQGASNPAKQLLIGYLSDGGTDPGFAMIQATETNVQNTPLTLNPSGGPVLVGTTIGLSGVPFQVAHGQGAAIADGWTTYSSRRWKTNIKTLPDALDKVEKLRGVSYDLKAGGKHEIGVIAEEVGAVVPEIVEWDQNGKDANGVDYTRLSALLIEAVKQQQAEIAQQDAKLAKQSAELANAVLQIKYQQKLMRQQKSRLSVLETKANATSTATANPVQAANRARSASSADLLAVK
jgi:Chaperone of endosialidase